MIHLKNSHIAGAYCINLENILFSGKTDEADHQFQEINKEFKRAVGHVGMEEHLSFQAIKLPLSWVPDALTCMFDQV